MENAEDITKEASKIVETKKINSDDVVICLAASGNTPFTCKVIEEAQKRNALTIAISNNPNGKILQFGKLNIILDTKEEVIAGSTRLKSGNRAENLFKYHFIIGNDTNGQSKKWINE